MTTAPTDATPPDSLPSSAAAVPPSTRRGQATRQALVEGARRVFERDGFVVARIVDIAKESGVATGSFYTYFADKDAVLAAVFGELQEEMLHPQLSSGGRQPLVSGVIAASHRAYLETYRANAKLMALREQVAAVDGAFRETRRARSREFVSRNARMITRLQAAGLADPELDPELTALSLSGMVARAAYSAFVLRDDVPMDHLVDTLTRLWMNALQIPEDAPALDGASADQGSAKAESVPAVGAAPSRDAVDLSVESEIDLDPTAAAADAAAKKAAKKAKAEKKRAKAEKKAKKLAKAKAAAEESGDVTG